MILSDFCDERGAVHTTVHLTGMSAHFASASHEPTPAQWAERRAQILVSRRFLVVDDVLSRLFHFTFRPSFVLLPGMLFEVLVDEDVRDLVRFEFEGKKMDPTECLEHFARKEES